MKFHHVGLVFPSRIDAERVARERFGEGAVSWQRVPAFACDCTFLAGHPMIELVVPDAGSRLAKYLGASPTALHHLAFSLAPFEPFPEPMMFATWAQGANGLLVNFGTPRDGLLIEYVYICQNRMTT